MVPQRKEKKKFIKELKLDGNTFVTSLGAGRKQSEYRGPRQRRYLLSHTS